MKLHLSIQYGTSAVGLPAKKTIRRWASAAIKGMRRRHVALGVRIVTANESAALNSRYRRQRRPTNVLSFPFEPPSGVSSQMLGDIVICAPIVRREAIRQHKTVRAHWAHMVVHGILHLRGFDHRQRQDAAVMENMELRILKELGYNDPYLQ